MACLPLQRKKSNAQKNHAVLEQHEEERPYEKRKEDGEKKDKNKERKTDKKINKHKQKEKEKQKNKNPGEKETQRFWKRKKSKDKKNKPNSTVQNERVEVQTMNEMDTTGIHVLNTDEYNKHTPNKLEKKEMYNVAEAVEIQQDKEDNKREKAIHSNPSYRSRIAGQLEPILPFKTMSSKNPEQMYSTEKDIHTKFKNEMECREKTQEEFQNKQRSSKAFNDQRQPLKMNSEAQIMMPVAKSERPRKNEEILYRRECEKRQRTNTEMGTNEHHRMKDKPEQNEDRKSNMQNLTLIKSASSVQREKITKKTEAHITVRNLLNPTNEHQDQLTTTYLRKITMLSLDCEEPKDEMELFNIFLQKLNNMNYMARYTCIKQIKKNENIDSNEANRVDKTNYNEDQSQFNFNIHPMDFQMSVFHHADTFLKQLMLTKLSQCQYAVPLLVPNLITKQIEFPLWTLRQINKDWKIKNANNKIITKTQPMYKAETPMVAFFRLGSVSSSKSQLMSNLINKKHDTFCHRNCKGSSRSRVLMDGVVEIAWYLPSGKTTDQFTDCVAFCNLHGDAADNKIQLNILTEMSSVNVVLLTKLDKNDKDVIKIQEIYKGSTPVICLLAEDTSSLIVMRKGKYKIGLKNRNQSELIEDIRRAIRDGISLSSTESSSVFRFEDVARYSGIKVDEADDEDCKRGKEVAQKIMKLLKNEDLTKVKESFLPSQGELWHQWCQKNKELHRPQGDKIEIDISKTQTDLKKIREQQQELDICMLIKLFLNEINSDNANEKNYFLKWFGILLDEHTSNNLSALRLKYNVAWLEVSELKKPKTKLEPISKKIEAATLGMEHILREIGQIYESCSSVQKNKEGMPFHFSSLPGLVAEMMISGFPLELMDGDAAHVPLIWITAVLDELVKKLGDQRVFVLSVLGIQSSGKSTLLNTMFGLQFPVSAGRCTRGAFMQLVKVSEEMKQQLKFDYILVVDTEGLCSSERSRRTTRQHDNELATFVVGLGNMTLINIFGESSAEMQNILQVIVQAFLRMKQVRLNSSCMFVHQNVDNTAEEKCSQARRQLQEELDKMTKLAAKEEDCDIKCFSEVIQFDVHNDVKYFPQLWEGTPPMAPPNPSYSECVQELKNTIIVSKPNVMMLTHLKEHISDLWEALLDERFVFSFKNSLEIANYKKLETEYTKWTWSLQNAMLKIENNLLYKIENEVIHDIKVNNLNAKLKELSKDVTKSMSELFKKHSFLIQWKTHFELKMKDLQKNIVKETERKLNKVLQQRDLKKKIDAQRTHHENTLFEKSKELALKFKGKEKDEKMLQEKFGSIWKKWVDDIIKCTPAIADADVIRDAIKIITSIYRSVPAQSWKKLSNITSVQSFLEYVISKKYPRDLKPIKNADRRIEKCVQTLSQQDDLEIKALVDNIVEKTQEMMKSYHIAQMGYHIHYISQLIHYIKIQVMEHEKVADKYSFKADFSIDLTIHICNIANQIFTERQRIFKKANDPVFYFQTKRGMYYSIFQKCYQGAKSSAIFGEIICNKLKEPIQQSAYKNTARELADEMKTNCESLNGNRSKLEKHILKTLAENENFDMYMNYIHNPREQFKDFIRDEVKKYIREKFSVSVVPKIKKNIEVLWQKIIETAHEASVCVKDKDGDVDLWLNHFTLKLSDVLTFSKKDLTGVSHDNIDVILLEDVMRTELPSVKFDINRTFKVVVFLRKLDYKDKPDEILIKHFCDCCWAQCPFCKAVCTNTMKNHRGDHSVPFHRNIGVNGWPYKGTMNLSVAICTSEVAGNNMFPCGSDNISIPWKEYKKAGPPYANWSIIPDLSELPYWKWFVCRFQKDLENHYNKTFQGLGEIPEEWKKYTKQNAIESLNKYN